MLRVRVHPALRRRRTGRNLMLAVEDCAVRLGHRQERLDGRQRPGTYPGSTPAVLEWTPSSGLRDHPLGSARPSAGADPPSVLC